MEKSHWLSLLFFGSTTTTTDDDVSSSSITVPSWDNVIEKSFYQVLYYICILLAWYVITEYTMKWVTNWDGIKLKKLAGQLSCYPAFFFLVYTSHIGTIDFVFENSTTSTTTTSSSSGGGFEKRYQTSTQIIDDFANFYIAANIVQAIGQIQTEKKPLLYQLMIHHILSIACYTSGFYFDRYRWWEAFAGCCEITNIFLVPVFACKEFFPNWQKQTWYLWNCRILWITFITHRLILFPCWLILWYYDRYQAIITGSKAINLHWIEGICYPLTIFGLLILSIIWFKAIHRGVKKQSKIYYKAREEEENNKKKK